MTLMVQSPAPSGRWALASLVLGAVGIGIAPLFVRFSDVGPASTGFFRMLFAVPLFGLLLQGEMGRAATAETTDGAVRGGRWLLVAGGVFFGLDIAFWHWSIMATSVANATLLTNLVPVFVVLGAALLFGERPSWLFLVALALALGGAVLLVGQSLSVSAATVRGDVLGMTSAVFYAAYQLCIKRARRGRSTLAVMTASTTVTAIVLLVIALASGETVLAASWGGWALLVGLALVSQVGGQGLIAYGLAHLSSGFASVTLLVQPVVAALLAWLVLSEGLAPLQALGGAVVLGGIVLARVGSMPRQ